MNTTIGIIGFGRFGQLAAKYLKNYFSVYVTDVIQRPNEARECGVTWTSFEECASKSIVLICVPISSFETTVKKLRSFVSKKSLVIDVCSVKENPVLIMKKYLSSICECIGTHPLFGPDTEKNTLHGKKIVICSINSTKTKDLSDFLSELGLKIIFSSPTDHDKQMAKSLALVHLIGRALNDINITSIEMSTPTCELFNELIQIVHNDSEKLFYDMQKYNRFTKPVRKQLIESLQTIEREIDAESAS